MPDPRDLVVVDVETTGLDIHRHWPIEVALINVRTGGEVYFVPAVPADAWAMADGDALKINRYYERGVYTEQLKLGETVDNWQGVLKALEGTTLGGSNPAFDAAMILKAATWAVNEYPPGPGSAFAWNARATWHHRLADLAAYAAPAFGLPPNELEGLAAVCARLGVTNDCDHGALGDARATAMCFKKLTARYQNTK